MEEPIQWTAQLGQDRFVSMLLEEKRGGTFFDIGAGEPQRISNTFVLERRFGWRGVLCDIGTCGALSIERGAGNIVHGDALTLDVGSSFAILQKDGWVDFLSLDLEPPELTFLMLMRIMSHPEGRFRVACVEHDEYRDGASGEHRRDAMRAIMLRRGYLHVQHVGMRGPDGKANMIEDWWIHSEAGLEGRAELILGDGGA
jgi:hypothetical protein